MAERAHVVSPELFDGLDEYASDLDGESAIVENVVPETSAALVFVQSAFAQFFENKVGVEIRSFDEKAKKRAARIRAGRRKELGKPAVSLIALFLQFCDTYEDVQSASYGGQAETLADFHQKLMVRLVKRIIDLAKADGDTELAERAADSLPNFKSIVDAYDWDQHDPDEEDDGEDE